MPRRGYPAAIPRRGNRGQGPHGAPWAPMGPHGPPWGPHGAHGAPMGPMGPCSSYCPRIFQENSGFFMKKCPKTLIFDQFGQCSLLCGTDTVSVWDTHSVSVWDTHSPGWRAGGSRTTPTPHWGFPVPTHTSKIAIPQLPGDDACVGFLFW